MAGRVASVENKVQFHNLSPGTFSFYFSGIAGDLRSNENIALTVHQTIWFRLHNVIVRALKASGIKLPAAELREEARRINIAVYQHIVYNEFLPLLVGNDTCGYDLKNDWYFWG